MLPKNRIPTHPGVILQKHYIEPMGLTQTNVAEKLKISVQRLNELINGKRGITPDTAWLLSGAFGTSPEFWMSLQAQCDLAKKRPETPVKRLRARAG